MRIAVGIALVLVVLLLAWLFFERTSVRPDAALRVPVAENAKAEQPSDPTAVETQPSAEVRRLEAAETAPAIASGARVQSHTLNVRSSVGLVLPFIEWQVSEIDWQRIDLDHGRCEIGPMKLPCLVRAPGHVAALAAATSEEIVLEPDALLLLESSNLRSCTSWIRPSDYAIGGDAYSMQDWDEARMRPALRRAITWGFVSDDRWALAVSSELAPDEVSTYPVESVVRWRDGRRADIQFTAKAGTRGTWAVPCEDFAATAGLDVHIVRSESDEAGPVSLRLVRIVKAAPESRSETHAWGSVVCQGCDYYQQSMTAPAGADSAHFDSVPLGIRFSLAGRDDRTSAYGRTVFGHDGTARTLDLRSAFEVTGRVVSSESSTPVTTMDWWWRFREGQQNVAGWQAAARAFVLPPDGRFSLRGPGESPIGYRVSLDPPAQLLLHIDAPGFESFEKLYETGGATRFDCGEIALVPRRRELALAPGHGLTLKSIQWFGLKISEAPEVSWTVRDVVPMPDGGLELFLLRDEKDPTLFYARPGAHRPWPEIPSERMLMHVLLENDDEPWAFTRGTDGRYVAVPRRQFDGEVECRAMPNEGASWFMGWRWRELWDTCEQIPAYDLGKKVRVHFSTPAEGATLYWSASGNPPHAGNEPGGWLPIEAVQGTLVLQ